MKPFNHSATSHVDFDVIFSRFHREFKGWLYGFYKGFFGGYVVMGGGFRINGRKAPKKRERGT